MNDFWNHVLIGDECWEWSGRRNGKNYGQFRPIPGVHLLAHRLSWELWNEQPAPDELFVCHHCDNPPCVRPDHLFLGTNTDNVRDCVAKGRSNSQKGSKHWNTKLTEEAVSEIRRLYNNVDWEIANKLKRETLAERFLVSEWSIYKIVNHLTWRHL